MGPTRRSVPVAATRHRFGEWPAHRSSASPLSPIRRAVRFRDLRRNLFGALARRNFTRACVTGGSRLSLILSCPAYGNDRRGRRVPGWTPRASKSRTTPVIMPTTRPIGRVCGLPARTIHYGGFDDMKRWILVSCLAIISALVVLVPVGAQASTVSGGRLYSGKPVKATISTPGRQIKYTFSATAHEHVTFQLTQFIFSNGSSGGLVDLYFYKPGSTSTYTSCAFSDNGYCDFTTPITGTWSVKLVPYASSVGSLTLTFARDVAAQALTSGTPVATTIKFEGQHAGYTFAATANKHVTFQVTQFIFSNGSSGGLVDLYFYKPGSTSTYNSCAFSDNGSCDFTTPVTGTWSVKRSAYHT